jgi:hypothetical protein
MPQRYASMAAGATLHTEKLQDWQKVDAAAEVRRLRSKQ